MPKVIRIGARLIGGSQAVFIIAEAGINHNGQMSYAKKLIDVAKDAGADAVKFQTFNTEELVTQSAQKADYQKEAGGSGESQYDMLKRLELKKGDFIELARYSKKRGITFLSTPFDKESVDLLDAIGMPVFKIGSGEITNFPLLTYTARKGKPIIISTGMATLPEIEEALKILRKQGAKNTILLHCVSSYPARIEDINLKVMETLKRAFRLPIGFSDHTLGLTASIAAVALGACVIEKHFTLDKKLPGPDHRASLEPNELKQMIRAIRDVEKAMGNGKKRPTKDEEVNKKAVRRSIIAKADILEGTIITEEILAVKRPGTGITSRYIERVVGRIARKNIRRNELIKWEMLQ